MMLMSSTAKPWWRRLAPWIALALVVLLLDQVTKTAIEQTMKFGDMRHVTDFFNIVLTYNTGAAFSFLADASGWQGLFFTVIGIGASLFILYLLARHGNQTLFSIALALILGGAIGNVIDRLTYGHVIDFLHFHWRGYSFPAFNLADSAIVCGAGLLIFDELRRVRRAK